VLDGVVTGDSYSYFVVATNAIGDSEPSSKLENIVAGTYPSVPTNLKRSTILVPDDTEINIEWEQPLSNGGSSVILYKVMWNGVTGGKDAEDELVETENRYYTVEGLIRGSMYKFTVAAINYVGKGAHAEPLVLYASQAPGVPSNIQRASFNSASEIMITWTAPTDEGGAPDTLDYEVWSDDGDQSLGTEYYLIAASTTRMTEYKATVRTGKTYFFKVKAFNVVGKS
jgi:titin